MSNTYRYKKQAWKEFKNRLNEVLRHNQHLTANLWLQLYRHLNYTYNLHLRIGPSAGDLLCKDFSKYHFSPYTIPVIWEVLVEELYDEKFAPFFCSNCYNRWKAWQSGKNMTPALQFRILKYTSFS